MSVPDYLIDPPENYYYEDERVKEKEWQEQEDIEYDRYLNEKWQYMDEQ